MSDLLRAASYLQLSELTALCHRKLKTCDFSPSIFSSSNSNKRLQVDQSFLSQSQEESKSHKDRPHDEDRSDEEVFPSAAIKIPQKLKPNPRGELSRQNRTESTSSSLQQSSPQSSTSSDDPPPKPSSAVRNPTLEQWYPRTDWKTAAQGGGRYRREDDLEGSVPIKRQEEEGGQDPEWKTSLEVENQNNVREDDSALRKELLKCEDSGSEDEEVKGNTSYIYQQQPPWLGPAPHESRYMCIPCGKGFPSSEHLMAHVDSHTTKDGEEEKYFRTKDQDPETLPQNSLKEELVNTLTPPRYTCLVCGKIFVDAAVLNQHERSHRLNRPFSCSVCGKLFTQRGTMTRHMRSHLGLKPFACEECGMRFTRQYRKMEHMRIHSREKPYQCQLCGLRFSHQRSVISHLKMHTTVSPEDTPRLIHLKPETRQTFEPMMLNQSEFQI